MPSKKRERHKRAGPQGPAKAKSGDGKVVPAQISEAGSFGGDSPRLLLALRDAAPGALFFVQINSPVQRRRLPEQLVTDGLQRPFAVADFAKLPSGPPPDGVLRQFLEDLKSTLPDILFVDGLEHRIDADPKPGGALEELNLSRERLANLGVVVVFLLPLYLIDLIRTYALNLWTWRAHHYSLDPVEVTPRHDSIMQSWDTGRAIAPGDTPEARERRIRILRRLLDEGLAEHRTVESLTHSILIPLASELYVAGRYGEALNVLDRVKSASEKAEDSLENATILSWQALVLDSLGRFNEAEPLYRRSLLIREKALGPDHPDVAASLNNLATLYRVQGRYGEAEPLYLRSLSIREKALGPDHPDVAASLNNLAWLYNFQGRYGEAKPLCWRSFLIREKALGPDHPNVAGSLNNLAWLYYSQGRYREAEPLYLRSLGIWEKAVGPDHPNMAASLNNLAALYDSQGRDGEAEPLYLRSLGIWEKAVGSDHPDVATVLENYVDLLRKTNRQAEAVEMEARARAIREKQT